jgi:DNA-binding NtrC family response regulator
MTMNMPEHDLLVITRSAAEIISTAMDTDQRVLLFGPPGVGKSMLATQLGAAGRLPASKPYAPWMQGAFACQWLQQCGILSNQNSMVCY